VAVKQPEPKQTGPAVQDARLKETKRTEPKQALDGMQTIQMLSLEAENSRLKGELADTAETVEILKNVISDYLKKERK
jgi:hypothetical protein